MPDDAASSRSEARAEAQPAAKTPRNAAAVEMPCGFVVVDMGDACLSDSKDGLDKPIREVGSFYDGF